jgi:hypothetical protein
MGKGKDIFQLSRPLSREAKTLPDDAWIVQEADNPEQIGDDAWKVQEADNPEHIGDPTKPIGTPPKSAFPA